jgi:hypothetical protein
MHDNSYGVEIDSLLIGDRWKWRISLPHGLSITSPNTYLTAEQAVHHGRGWWSGEAVFHAVSLLLLELRQSNRISHQEYSALMQSVVCAVPQL